MFARQLLGAVVLCLTFLLHVPASKADELYKFVQLQCLPELATLKIERFALWNVGDFIWPYAPLTETDRAKWRQRNWDMHVENLRRLEEKYGIYVVDQAYGRWDEQPVECDLGYATIRIEFKKKELETGTEGEGVREFRGPGTVSVLDESGPAIWQDRLHWQQATFTIQDSGTVLLLGCDNGQYCDPQNYQPISLP